MEYRVFIVFSIFRQRMVREGKQELCEIGADDVCDDSFLSYTGSLMALLYKVNLIAQLVDVNCPNIACAAHLFIDIHGGDKVPSETEHLFTFSFPSP